MVGVPSRCWHLMEAAGGQVRACSGDGQRIGGGSVRLRTEYCDVVKIVAMLMTQCSPALVPFPSGSLQESVAVLSPSTWSEAEMRAS